MSGTATQTTTRPELLPRPKQPVPWNVVLLDDDDHSYEYVVSLMTELFAASSERAFQVAKVVDTDGRAVCMTTHKELAELKRDQIHAYGKDRHIAGCQGSMSAVIEPAAGPEDGHKS